MARAILASGAEGIDASGRDLDYWKIKPAPGL